MLELRTMTVADIPAGMRLKTQAGWNQVEADWERALALAPDGCFVAEEEGRIVGTTATAVFGPVAWIAMVLVDEACRRRGIATRLMEHALAHLDGRGVRTVRLDATPLGRPVYERLGFEVEYELTRWQGVAVLVRAAASAPVTRLVETDWADLLALDRQASGTDRAPLLRALARQNGGQFWTVREGTRLAGYSAIREGSGAVQIGPMITENEDAGRALGSAAQVACAGRPAFIDVPPENAAAGCWVRNLGLTAQRQLVRMWRGEAVRDRQDLLWASFGPEKG